MILSGTDWPIRPLWKVPMGWWPWDRGHPHAKWGDIFLIHGGHIQEVWKLLHKLATFTMWESGVNQWPQHLVNVGMSWWPQPCASWAWLPSSSQDGWPPYLPLHQKQGWGCLGWGNFSQPFLLTNPTLSPAEHLLWFHGFWVLLLLGEKKSMVKPWAPFQAKALFWRLPNSINTE